MLLVEPVSCVWTLFFFVVLSILTLTGAHLELVIPSRDCKCCFSLFLFSPLALIAFAFYGSLGKCG